MRRETQEILLKVKRQHGRVRRLTKQLREMRTDMAALPGQRLDGMPRGGAVGQGGVVGRVIGVDQMERRVGFARERLRRAQDRAGEAVLSEEKKKIIGDSFATFCLAYYVRGRSFDEARAFAERSARQCRRYMMEIERKEHKSVKY